MKAETTLIKKTLAILCIFISFTLIACSPPGKQSRGFAFEFRYGVGAKNVLDTFNGKFTKDMVVDEAITIDFKLDTKQLEKVHDKMLEIDFFNYPERFSPKDNSLITPHESYYFKVRASDKIKELYWDDKNLSSDPEAVRLRELIQLIRDMVGDSFEYRVLPQPRSGYM